MKYQKADMNSRQDVMREPIENPVGTLKEYLERSDINGGQAVYKFSEYRDGFVCIASALGKQSTSRSWLRKKSAKEEAAEELLYLLTGQEETTDRSPVDSSQSTLAHKQSMIAWHLNEAQRILAECRNL